MFTVLYQYLIEKKQVLLQGTGQLMLIRQPASYNEAEQQFYPPVTLVELQKEEILTLRPLLEYIATQLSVSYDKAQELYRLFCQQIAQQLADAGQWDWPALGSIKKTTGGKLAFEMAGKAGAIVSSPVIAHKLVKDELEVAAPVTEEMQPDMVAEQAVTVEEVLIEEESKKSRWWIAAIILGAAAAALITLKKMGIV